MGNIIHFYFKYNITKLFGIRINICMILQSTSPEESSIELNNYPVQIITSQFDSKHCLYYTSLQ